MPASARRSASRTLAFLGDSIGRRNSVLLSSSRHRPRASAGVFQQTVFRGLALRVAATATIISVRWALSSVPLGMYCRSSPMVFSLVPPRALGIAEVDLDAGVDPECRMLCHLSTLVPRQGTAMARVKQRPNSPEKANPIKILGADQCRGNPKHPDQGDAAGAEVRGDSTDAAVAQQTYEVGYCKPPIHTRFQPGRGGKGRQKGQKASARLSGRL